MGKIFLKTIFINYIKSVSLGYIISMFLYWIPLKVISLFTFPLFDTSDTVGLEGLNTIFWLFVLTYFGASLFFTLKTKRKFLKTAIFTKKDVRVYFLTQIIVNISFLVPSLFPFLFIFELFGFLIFMPGMFLKIFGV